MINTDRLIKLFCQMVSIDSESGNESRFAIFIQAISQECHLKSRIDSYGNVYIEFPGNRDEPLMINTHMDTVVPGTNINPQIKDGYITSDGSTILGADSKASIAAIFEAIKIIQEQQLDHRPIVITLTCNEETGIPTATKIKSSIKNCVVMDRGAPLGQVILKSPFAQVFEVIIRGKTAYATSNFVDGRHAILAGCEMISKLPIGNFDAYSTSNIGLIQGGIMTTTIPDKCSFKGNCYSFKKESMDSFFKTLKQIINDADEKYGTRSTVNLLEYFGGYKIRKTDLLSDYVKKTLERSGFSAQFKVYKTVTNANNLNEIGIKAILISTGVEYQHTLDERIQIITLEDLTRIVIGLMTGKEHLTSS